MTENRRAKRINTNLKILMEPIGKVGQSVMADVVDVSRTGVGFLSSVQIEDHSFYKARLILESKDKLDAVIETVRHVPKTDTRIMYGGRFVGMNETDQFKIEVFRIVAENNS